MDLNPPSAGSQARPPSAPTPFIPRRGGFRPYHPHHPSQRPPYPHPSSHIQNAARPGSVTGRPYSHASTGNFRPSAFTHRGRGSSLPFARGRGGGVGSGGPVVSHQLPTLGQRRELRNVVEHEETIKNDYALWFAVGGGGGGNGRAGESGSGDGDRDGNGNGNGNGDGSEGVWSANWIKRVEADEDCKEYPKLRHLLDLKSQQVDLLSHPPMHFSLPHLSSPSPSLLIPLLTPPLPPSSFTSILITPPPSLTPTQLFSLPIRYLSSDPSFVFLWVGEASGLGLEVGREALLKWGYRRCEEILWIKTNKKGRGRRGVKGDERGEGEGGGRDDERKPKNLLVNMKEHCLMGIRGTVRRKTDGWFVHCNVDTDVMVWEQDPDDLNPLPYPPKLLQVIENFCLGTRRLHLFEPKSRARRGWVTVGEDDSSIPKEVKSEVEETKMELETGGTETETDAKGPSPSTPDQTPRQILAFDLPLYNSLVQPDPSGRYVLPLVPEIESLRPKSPVRGDRGGRSDPSMPAPGMGAGAGAPAGAGAGGRRELMMAQAQATARAQGQGQGQGQMAAGRLNSNGFRQGERASGLGMGSLGLPPRMNQNRNQGQAEMGNQNQNQNQVNLGMGIGVGMGNGMQGMSGLNGEMGFANDGASYGMDPATPLQQYSGAFNPLLIPNNNINNIASTTSSSSSSSPNPMNLGSGYHGGTAFGHQQNGNSMIQNDLMVQMQNPMYMAMAMQQMQMQMQMQQAQRMYMNGMMNSGQEQGQGQFFGMVPGEGYSGNGSQTGGYRNQEEEEEYDGQYAWREGQ